jgi:penicillin-binding protein 1B
MDLDVLEVVKTLQRLGIQRDLPPYPSLLLGAVPIPPFEVAQMYESIASGGAYIRLRAIREVTAGDATRLQRYEYEDKRVIERGPAYLITHAMQRVIKAGTSKVVNKILDPELNLAGKTGTTDDLRDSWFAGFSGNYLTVVWLGRDNNKSIRLTGANGALRVWIEIMRNLKLEPVSLTPPPGVVNLLVDPGSGRLADENCRGAKETPFIVGSEPRSWASCARNRYYAGATDYVEQPAGSSYEHRAPMRPSAPSSKEKQPAPESGSSSLGDFFKRLLD